MEVNLNTKLHFSILTKEFNASSIEKEIHLRMAITYKLDSIGDAVEIATTLSGSWFRGHPRVHEELVPKLLREKYVSHASLELSLIEAFKRVAPALDANVPKQDDNIAWLFLMQHHGVSTRLLDWTKSALIALYFVVVEHETEDGELWAMYPNNLNKLSGIPGLPLRNNPVLKYFVEEPLEDPKMLQSLYNLPQIPDKPIAIEPQMNFPRIMAQLSKFTIHPISNQAKLISTLLTDEKDLVRYIVPSDSKSKFRSDLATLGITHTALFPSLDALGRDIIYDHRVVAYSPPNPPKCKGLWVKPTQ